MAAGTTPLVESLVGIADCARSLVQLCLADPDRFHRHLADELRLTLFQQVQGKPGEVISTLFRPTGEFDLKVEMSASAAGLHQLAIYFDASRVAWCSSIGVSTGSTMSAYRNLTGCGAALSWTVDQVEAALWASGVDVAPDDTVGVTREIEAAALDAWDHLAELMRYAQRDSGVIE